MKFCLSFYSDEHHCNLYHLRKNKGDKYLSYRLAHCVLLYSDEKLSDNYIRKQNKELLEFLPNHQLQQSIYLGLPVYTGDSRIKKTIQYILHNKFGLIIQNIIRIAWTPIILYKKSKLKPRTQHNIIISDTMLKFHDDQRDLFEFRQKSAFKKKI